MLKDNTYKTQTERIYKVPLCIQDTILIYRISQGGIWMMSRNYTFIPYKTLSDYQKALVRRTLDAKRLYHRTGTSLQLHEQSVRAIKRWQEKQRNWVFTVRQVASRHVSH